MTKTQILSMIFGLVLLTVGLNAYAETNSTATNSTSTNQTLIIEPEIIQPIVIKSVVGNPHINMTSQAYQQGDLVKLSGYNVEPNQTVEITVYHPNNSKFGIFKTTSTKDGEFQLTIEMVPTSLKGKYKAIATIDSVTITKEFVYDTNALSLEATSDYVDSNPKPIEQPIEQLVAEVIPEETQSIVKEKDDWNLFLNSLNPEDRLELIRAVMKYLFS